MFCTGLVFHSEITTKCMVANSNDIQVVTSFPKQCMLQSSEANDDGISFPICDELRN